MDFLSSRGRPLFQHVTVKNSRYGSSNKISCFTFPPSSFHYQNGQKQTQRSKVKCTKYPKVNIKNQYTKRMHINCLYKSIILIWVFSGQLFGACPFFALPYHHFGILCTKDGSTGIASSVLLEWEPSPRGHHKGSKQEGIFALQSNNEVKFLYHSYSHVQNTKFQ